MSKDLELENEKLKQQLAEKEKEIEKLKEIKAIRNEKTLKTEIDGVEFTTEQIMVLQRIGIPIEDHDKQLRHEICEKIRKEIKQLIENKDNSLTNWEYANGWCSALQYNMAEILQKIEKGEE